MKRVHDNQKLTKNGNVSVETTINNHLKN